MVPRRDEPPPGRETAAPRRRLPGAEEHHKPGLVRPDGDAQRPGQTPAAGGSGGNGESQLQPHTPDSVASNSIPGGTQLCTV